MAPYEPDLPRVVPLPSDLAGTSVGPVLDALDRATERLTRFVRANVGVLTESSLLPGWSRVTVLCHLRYVAEAMSRMTDAAVSGRTDDMYPGGRDLVRPGTLVMRVGESLETLVESVASTALELRARWNDLAASDWDRRVVDRDHGAIALSRFLALRLTEVEVHSLDLGLPGLDSWSDAFVDMVLPLRLAWLGTSRHRPVADHSINGSWVLTDSDAAWLVTANGADVVTGRVSAERSGDSRIAGTRRDLLAFLLGRPAHVERTGRRELADGSKAAFPGP
jgi:uncharacterized protein (TIGR03083 family)